MTCGRCENNEPAEHRHGMTGHPVEADNGAKSFLACGTRPADEIALACPYTPDPRAFDLCYLATPYTKFPGGIDLAFKEAARVTGRLMRAGVRAYSPIAHTHPVAKYAQIDPLDHAIWLPFDEAQMRAAGCCIVAQMPTWSISFGVRHEIDFFEGRQKPVVYLDPISLRMSREPHRGLA